MYRYLPDFIAKSIFEMDLKKLKDMGIKGLAVDIDNTLVPMNVKEPSEQAAEWVEKAKTMGFQICILSNAMNHRAELFMDKLGIHGVGFAQKPSRKGYDKAAERMGLTHRECAILGDQLFTDIKGGVKAGFVTVFTEYLDSNEIKWIKFKRIFEDRIIKKNTDGIEKI